MSKKTIEEYLEKREEYKKSSKTREEVEILQKICKYYKEEKNQEKYIYYLNELGGASKYIGEYKLAIDSLNEAKEEIIKFQGKNSIEYATCLLNLTEVYRFKEEFDKLENLYLEVLEIYEKNNMQEDYRYAGLTNNLGLFYQNINKLDKAIIYHEKSLSILENKKEYIVEYATTLNNLVIPYKEMNKIEKSKEYLEKALLIYEKELGRHHSMYSAALNNKAIIKFEEKDYLASLNLFKESLEIVKKSFGENSLNYHNLKSNVDYLEDLVKSMEVKKVNIDINENSKLIDKSREYTIKYIIPILKEKLTEVLDKISIGLIGEGSEVISLDDEYSKDHDYTFMPAIFLSDENYEKYANKIREILLSLPNEFLGIKHIENDILKERRGVLKLEEYIYRFLGKEDANLSIEDYKKIPEHALFSLTAGEIFYSGDKKMEEIREKLVYYPDIIRENKIATVCTKIAQAGQYNFLRLMKRNDIIGANSAKSIFIENVISLIYLLNRKYKPFYKWHSYELKNMNENIYNRLIEIITRNDLDMYQMSNKMEEICYYLVEELKKQKLTNEKGYFLLNHAIYIQKNIKDDFLSKWTAFED